MIKLLFIVPYPELEEKVKNVIASHPKKRQLDAEVRMMTVRDTPDVPAADYDAIIARGYTARKTRAKYKDIPTIELTVSGYDLVRAISECCEKLHPEKIAVFGFGRQIYETGSISRLFGVEAADYTAVEPEHLPDAMRKALKDGCDAVIGGYSATIAAERAGLPAVTIRTGEDTILQAVDEAVNTVEQIRSREVTSQLYKTVLYANSDGVFFVDADGVIQVRSHVARHMLGDRSLMGQRLDRAAPFLFENYRKALDSGEEVLDRVLTIPGTKQVVSVRFTPVITRSRAAGVVISLSDITRIQELEGQIRKQLHSHGMKAKYRFRNIIWQSRVMEQVIGTAKRYALSSANVIIVGETGTGKELFAQSIHNESLRKDGPFVAINCAALPDNLLESELFGYEEGAFTGSRRGGKMGLFELAHGGTLFLDEIEEISAATQSKLLRVLQERQVRRIGSSKVTDIDVRIISATNRGIAEMTGPGHFRKDLMYRLDVLRLFIPPLRSRMEDAELLFRSLLKEYAEQQGQAVPAVRGDALALLRACPFEGNIRELRNIVERSFVMQREDGISEEVLRQAIYPEDIGGGMSFEAVMTPAREPETGEEERERILEALRVSGGKKARAAALLRMDRTTLWRKLRKYGIE